MTRKNRTLTIAGPRELNAATIPSFRSQVRAALDPDLGMIEIDLSDTTVVDSSGLAALVWVFKAANRRNRNGGVVMRLLRPRPPVLQMLELTRVHHLFEIVDPPETSAPERV